MSMDWEEKRVGDLGRIVTGKTPSTKIPEYFGDKYPFITPTDLEYDNQIPNYERALSEKGYLCQQNLLLPPKTICYTSIGATIGKMCITKIPSFTNQQINSVIVNKDKNDYWFVYYLLRKKTEDIKGMAGGAATPIVNKTTFSNVKVKIPPLPTQRKIAGVLSAYDDLIENNTRRIAILEEMAQRIYKEWFVDFKYPEHENDTMVDSELGPIPEGWEVKSLMESNYFNFIRTNISEFEGEKTYFATADVNGTQFVKTGIPYQYSNKPSRAQKQPIENSVWFARMKDSFKVVGFTNVNSSFAENSMISSGFAGFRSDNETFGFVYNTILTDEFHSLKDTFCTGATQMSLTNDGLSRIKWVNPIEPIVLRYSEITNPIIDNCLLLRKKNQTLRQTRDLLLPKLISGKVDVSELNIDIGAHA